MLIDLQDSDFDRLFAEHAQGLFAFLAYRTGDRALAEEVTSEAFEKVLRARRRYDPERSAAKTWLYSIALNCLRDRMRRAGAEARALERVEADGVDVADARLEAAEERDSLWRALEALSEEERQAIALRYGGELTVPEIAELLGEKLSTVEGRVYRALRKLRSELA